MENQERTVIVPDSFVQTLVPPEMHLTFAFRPGFQGGADRCHHWWKAKTRRNYIV
jgi:hypothetical protein